MLRPVWTSAVVVATEALSPGETPSFHGNWSWYLFQISCDSNFGAPARTKPARKLSKYVPRVLPRFVPPNRQPCVSVAILIRSESTPPIGMPRLEMSSALVPFEPRRQSGSGLKMMNGKKSVGDQQRLPDCGCTQVGP